MIWPQQPEVRTGVSREDQIRSDILLSARRMIAGLKVAKREQANLTSHLKMLEKYGERGAASKFAHDSGDLR